jgi:adenylylsulfate kinase
MPEAVMDSHTRSLAKAISYRLLGSLTTALIFFLLTGKSALSIGAGALDMVLKLALYFVHERVWNHIGFGRAKPPEYEI